MSKKHVPFTLLSDKTSRVKGLYVHTNPPKVLSTRCNLIRQWLQSGDITQLEHIVLQGQGHKLLGEHSSDPKTQSFLKQVPVYMDKINKLHRALSAGDLKFFEKFMEDKQNDDYMQNIFLSKNYAGLSFLHKAVFHGFPTVVKFLVSNFPQNINEKDKEGKTPLHYCGASEEANKIWDILIKNGANLKIRDRNGKLPYYYMQQPQEIRLSNNSILPKNTINFDSTKTNFDIKASNIRIWIHDQDLKNLRKLIWEGHGKKLQVETSNHPKIKKFLEGVPILLNIIKDVHSAVINNDLEEFIKKSSEPVPIEVLDSKDNNGLNPLHKASGLGRLNIASYILQRNPKLVFSTDHNGRTPLHFAAALKNDDSLYNFLKKYGADETICDKSGKMPYYYKTNSKEIIAKVLQVVPEAPRTTGMFPTNWDWALFHSNEFTPTTLVSTSSVKKKKNKSEQKRIYSAMIFSPIHNSIKVGQKLYSESEKKTENLNELSSPEKFSNENIDKNINVIHLKPRNDNENEIAKSVEEIIDLSKNTTTEIGSVANVQIDELKKKENINIWNNNDSQESKEKKNCEEPIKKEKSFYKKNEKEDEKNRDDISYLCYNSELEKMSDSEEIENKKKTEREIAEERQKLLDECEFKHEDKSQKSCANDEVDKLIEKEDMEALAFMVLNGEGNKLKGKTSTNQSIQSFLNNLSSYMAKITAVHEAVRRGSLNALQVALDRRRYAVAKKSSGNLGVTPLHVAVLFGKSSIIKYLGGKFPETLNSKDNFGRTPLHYAAILPDKNNFFNILINLGADTKIKDEAGHTPQFYQENRSKFTYETLIEDFDFDTPGQIAKDMIKDPDIEGISSPIADLSLKEVESDMFFNEGTTMSKHQEIESLKEISEIVHSQKNFTNIARDEYGQSILHFAAARIHGRHGLYHLIQESRVNLGYRDELYRTARDIALQANIPGNIKEIDKYVISLAARGETEKLTELFLEGYDHILDVQDDENNDIISVASKQNKKTTLAFLKSIPLLERKRERIHEAIRDDNYKLLQDICEEANQKLTIIGKSKSGRCSLHVAILCQRKDITEFIAQRFPETLKVGDNLDRTPLHYAMGVDEVETFTKILIKCGAKRISKDIKGRQPTYYFLNKSEILKLQEEENLKLFHLKESIE